MKKIGLFYGSNLGTTLEVSERIWEKLDKKIEIYNIAESSKSVIEIYKNLILGTSTWGYGELQDDWKNFIEQNPVIDLENRKIAIFGLGDQDSHKDVFVNGIGKLFNYVKENKADVVGLCDIKGYDYGHDTTAVKDRMFVGLPIDEINQPELTDDRLNKWLKVLLKEFI